jgi:hypothetical protein
MSDLPERPPKSEPPSPEVVTEMLRLQHRQLDLRSREIDIRELELEHKREEAERGFDFAKSALAAQVDDVKQIRTQQSKTTRYGMIITLAGLVIIAATVIYSLYLGKEQFVLELAKLIIAALGGGGVGYAIGHRKAHQQQEEIVEE